MGHSPETLIRRTASDPLQWRQVLETLPHPHVLQTWEWGAVKERQGWKATHLLWERHGKTQAAALVLSRRAGGLPVKVIYVPKGPVLDYGAPSLVTGVLADLEGLARQEGAVFIKIDPDAPVEDRQVAEILRLRGWRPSREQVQFRNTLLVDLTPDLDEVLARMKPKWRYNIRLAERKGVKVRAGTIEDLPLLYEMYRETSMRDRFVIRPEGYYRDVWQTFIEAGLAWPLIAEVEGQPVAMVVLFHLGQRAWYMYGASRLLHRERMPNHLLQWEAIRWAKARGCTAYDLWGAPEVLDPSHPMWGVFRFKEGFGARLVRHIGAYDYPVNRSVYWLYTALAPRLLSLMRWRHWQRQGAAILHPGEGSV